MPSSRGPPATAWEAVYHLAKFTALAMGYRHYRDLLVPDHHYHHHRQNNNGYLLEPESSLWDVHGDARFSHQHFVQLKALHPLVTNAFDLWDLRLNEEGKWEEFSLDKFCQQVFVARRMFAYATMASLRARGDNGHAGMILTEDYLLEACQALFGNCKTWQQLSKEVGGKWNQEVRNVVPPLDNMMTLSKRPATWDDDSAAVKKPKRNGDSCAW